MLTASPTPNLFDFLLYLFFSLQRVVAPKLLHHIHLHFVNVLFPMISDERDYAQLHHIGH